MRLFCIYLFCALLVLCASSCPAEPPCTEMEILTLYISNDKKRAIAYPYQYAYGLGMHQKQIQGTKYYSSDTVFNLPLNVNTDKCSFVLLRTDGSSDTIHLKYKINYHLENRCGFRFETNDLNIDAVSSRFNLDSSSIIYDYINYLAVVRLK